ncbi:MAG: hypothetical protein D6815_12395, partial [Candidatus Dadabacteria bacterium]
MEPHRAVKPERASDTEVFLITVAACAMVLLAGGALFASLASAGPSGASLAGRLAPLPAVRAVYAWFGMLPAGLAAVGIGLPFALRSAVAVARRRVRAGEALGLSGVAAGVILIAVPAGPAWKAPALLVFILVSALAGGRRVIGEHGGRWARALLLLAAAGLAGT